MGEESGEKESSKGLPEIPGGMDQEAQLLEKFFEVPAISKVAMTKPSSPDEPINITVRTGPSIEAPLCISGGIGF